MNLPYPTIILRVAEPDLMPKERYQVTATITLGLPPKCASFIQMREKTPECDRVWDSQWVAHSMAVAIIEAYATERPFLFI